MDALNILYSLIQFLLISIVKMRNSGAEVEGKNLSFLERGEEEEEEEGGERGKAFKFLP